MRRVKISGFRGPVKPMTTAELQKNVDSHLGISGDSGRFKITVAKEGMIWAPRESPKYSSNENVPIGSVIEIEGLQEYVCKIEKLNKEDKLKISIEDRINRYNMQFDRPRRDKNNDQLIRGAAEKGNACERARINNGASYSTISGKRTYCT